MNYYIERKRSNNMFSPESAAAMDGIMRCCFPAHPDFKKSDGFLFVLDRTVLIHDSGMRQSRDLYDKMIELKKAMCPDQPLEVIWVLSHYHPDHIGAAVDVILPDPAFRFKNIYLPPRCNISDLFPGNGEERFYALLQELLAEYQPQAEITELKFANEGGVPLSFGIPVCEPAAYNKEAAVVTLFPPDANWSEPHLMNDLIIQGYYDGDATRPVPTCILNSASLWMMITYAGRRMLFTGDSMKRTSSITCESFDRMVEIWSDSIGKDLDLMKWPHHGMIRNNALGGVMSLTPKNILVTTVVETASAFTFERCPDCKSRFFNNAFEDVCVKIGPDGRFEIG